MLNTAVATKFQCGGFQVGPLRPFATVTTETQQEQIRRAVADGKLVDITGTDLAQGIKTKTGSTSKIEEEDTGKKAYVSTDARGNLYVVTPKTKTEQKKLERELKKTGTIKVDYAQAAAQVSSISPIITEDLPQEPPAHGSSQRRIRKSRRSKH